MSGLQLKTAPLFITKYELSNRRPAERLTYKLSLFYQSDFQLLSSSFLWGSATRQYRVEVLCSETTQKWCRDFTTDYYARDNTGVTLHTRLLTTKDAH